MGGTHFMSVLTILLIITTTWIIYHFIFAYTARPTTPKKILRKLSYGKTMGLFTMIVGITGQMNGLYAMFTVIETRTKQGLEIRPEIVFGGIKVTMIVTIYGILIYLFSLVLWFVATILIEKKQAKQG